MTTQSKKIKIGWKNELKLFGIVIVILAVVLILFGAVIALAFVWGILLGAWIKTLSVQLYNEKIESIWDGIKHFSSYGFNDAHKLPTPREGGTVVMPKVDVDPADVQIGGMPSAEAALGEGEPTLAGADFGGDGPTVVVTRQPTAKVEEQAERLYERLREGKAATRAWKDLPDCERWIWRRAVRFAIRGRERLKEAMLDESAITKAEDAQRSFQKAADDPWDDTGWAEPMTEAVGAAFDCAIEKLDLERKEMEEKA